MQITRCYDSMLAITNFAFIVGRCKIEIGSLIKAQIAFPHISLALARIERDFHTVDYIGS